MIDTQYCSDWQSFDCSNHFQHLRHITLVVVHRLCLDLEWKSLLSDHDDHSAEFSRTRMSRDSSTNQKCLFVRFNHQSDSQIFLQRSAFSEIKSSAFLSFHDNQYSDLDFSDQKNQTKTKHRQTSRSISRKWRRKRNSTNMNSLSFSLFLRFSTAINLETIIICKKLSILQYNVHKFKDLMMTSFLRDSTIKRYDIIVVQKSWINVYANIIHHFLKDNHFLFYSNQIEMKKNLVRICTFVIKRIFIDDLKYLFRSKNVMIIQIRLHENHYMHLHNVYNESDILSSSILQNLRFALKSSSNEQFKDHIIMKDLNIHHSTWKDFTIRSNSRSFEMLLVMNEFRLQFNFSRKTSTYFHFQKSKSIIDMCLTTKDFNDWSHHRSHTHRHRRFSEIFYVVHSLRFLQREFNRLMHQFTSWDHRSRLHKRHKNSDNERINWRKRNVTENDSRRIVHDLSSSTWVAICFD
jgi:hypothetical protein